MSSEGFNKNISTDTLTFGSRLENAFRLVKDIRIVGTQVHERNKVLFQKKQSEDLVQKKLVIR